VLRAFADGARRVVTRGAAGHVRQTGVRSGRLAPEPLLLRCGGPRARGTRGARACGYQRWRNLPRSRIEAPPAWRRGVAFGRRTAVRAVRPGTCGKPACARQLAPEPLLLQRGAPGRAGRARHTRAAADAARPATPPSRAPSPFSVARVTPCASRRPATCGKLVCGRRRRYGAPKRDHCPPASGAIPDARQAQSSRRSRRGAGHANRGASCSRRPHRDRRTNGSGSCSVGQHIWGVGPGLRCCSAQGYGGRPRLNSILRTRQRVHQYSGIHREPLIVAPLDLLVLRQPFDQTHAAAAG